MVRCVVQSFFKPRSHRLDRVSSLLSEFQIVEPADPFPVGAVQRRKARPQPLLAGQVSMSPLSIASFHSTCMWRIRRRTSSGASKFISQASLNSDNHVRVSFRMGSF